MYEENKRLYVGNLPPGTSENDIKRKLKKFGKVISVEVKQAKQELNDHTYAFVDFQVSSSGLQSCIEKWASKLWKGHQVKIQLAKESFLQRLERERQLSKITLKGTNLQPYQNNITKADYIENGFGQKCDSPHTTCKKKEECEPRDELQYNKNLSMFPGLKLLGEYPNASIPEFPIINGRIENKQEMEEQITSKFKSFNKISHDFDVCISPNKGEEKTYKHASDINKMKYLNKSKDKLACNDHVPEANNCKEEKLGLLRRKQGGDCKFEEQQRQRGFLKQEEATHQVSKTALHQNLKINEFSTKSDQAEEKRIKSLEERHKALLQKKKTIHLALASVDGGVTCNKKIIFDDDCDDDGNNSRYHTNEQIDADAMESAGKKLKGKDRMLLFNDDSDAEEVIDDFKIRKQYEGRKGQKLLELQSRYGNDRRFMLDERFYESDEFQSDEDKTVINSKDEKLQQLQVLQSVLGEEISTPQNGRSKYENRMKSILRFDPTQAEHKKFEIVQEPRKKKKRIIHDLQEESEKRAGETLSRSTGDGKHMPNVSKEKYYKVTDTLKESLQKQDSNKFSLLKLFGNETELADGEAEGVHYLPSTSPGWLLNTFKYDSSDSESEMRPETRKHENTSGVQSRSETFFFLKDDARFQEGLDFIKCRNEDYIENFVAVRPELKTVVKKKIGRWKRQSNTWKTKIATKTGKKKLK